MPIGLTAKIEPKNDGFQGLVDDDQIIDTLNTQGNVLISDGNYFASGSLTGDWLNTSYSQTTGNLTLSFDPNASISIGNLTADYLRLNDGDYRLTLQTDVPNANATLTLGLGSTSTTLWLLGSDIRLNDWFNQSVKTDASPSFAGLSCGDILPQTDDTSSLGDETHRWEHLYISKNIYADGQVQAEYLVGDTQLATAGEVYITKGGNYPATLKVDETTHNLEITSYSGIVDFLTDNIKTSGNLTDGTNSVSIATIKSTCDNVDQDVTTTGTPQFSRLGVGTAASSSKLINAIGTLNSSFFSGFYGDFTNNRAVSGTYTRGLNFYARWKPADSLTSNANMSSLQGIYGYAAIDSGNITSSYDITATNLYGARLYGAATKGSNHTGNVTVTTYYGLQIQDISLSGGATCTNGIGLYIDNIDSSSNNFSAII